MSQSDDLHPNPWWDRRFLYSSCFRFLTRQPACSTVDPEWTSTDIVLPSIFLTVDFSAVTIVYTIVKKTRQNNKEFVWADQHLTSEIYQSITYFAHCFLAWVQVVESHETLPILPFTAASYYIKQVKLFDELSSYLSLLCSHLIQQDALFLSVSTLFILSNKM